MIKVENLYKDFGDGPVLNNITTTFESDKVTVIIGPSGSGKSTLLRTLNYLEVPSNGTVYFNDTTMNEHPKTLQNARKDIAMVFQSFNLFNHLSILENCIVAQVSVLKRDKEAAKEKAYAMLKKVHMDGFANKKPGQLSGGQKQRAAIARALSMDPKVLLLDEPTSALDPETVGEVLEVIKNLSNDGITMVLVTHEMQFANDVADRVIFMDRGKIVEDRLSNDIFISPTHERTKLFFKKLRLNAH